MHCDDIRLNKNINSTYGCDNNVNCKNDNQGKLQTEFIVPNVVVPNVVDKYQTVREVEEATKETKEPLIPAQVEIKDATSTSEITGLPKTRSGRIIKPPDRLNL